MALGEVGPFNPSFTVNVTFVDLNYKALVAEFFVDGPNAGLTDAERNHVAKAIARKLIDLRPDDTVQSVTITRSDITDTDVPFTP